MNHKSIELKSCVKGEQINVFFSGCENLYMALLTEEGYKDYEEGIHSLHRNFISCTPARFIAHKEGVLYVVACLNGSDIVLSNLS